jgi:predicted metal-dependent RNase
LKKWLKFYKDRFIELEKIDNPTEIEINEKISLATVINTINEQISVIQKTLFTGNIVLDSPLVVRINKVFLKHLWDKYSLLNPEVQKEIFGKELIRYLDRGEYKDLYTAERIRSKEAIISSGWMLQGWSIINHLKHIIEDPKSKLIFTGYQWEWTLWAEILSGKKQIIIEDKVYDVRCQVVQIRWYSSHIGKNDIIDYTARKLNYSKKAKLALTHGTELREWLAVEIQDVMKKSWKKVDILIPKLWDEVKIKI